MEERDTLLKHLDESRARIQSVVEKISTDRELYSGWTMKHFLAHLTGWDEATIQSLRAHADSRVPGTPAYRGLDYYNEQSVAERIGLEYRHVIHEWQMARETLKKTLIDLPDERFAVPLIFPWGPTGSVVRLVEIMVHHEYEHADELEKLHLRSAESPASIEPERGGTE